MCRSELTKSIGVRSRERKSGLPGLSFVSGSKVTSRHRFWDFGAAVQLCEKAEEGRPFARRDRSLSLTAARRRRCDESRAHVRVQRVVLRKLCRNLRQVFHPHARRVTSVPLSTWASIIQSFDADKCAFSSRKGEKKSERRGATKREVQI